ncbi:hypothetical protein Tco_0223039 [Tanacetum coccineum]
MKLLHHLKHHPPSKTSPLIDDDLDEEEAIKVNEKKNLENEIEDKTLEVDEIVNIKESKNHPLGNVIDTVMCGHYLGDGFCSFCNSEAGNSFVNDSNPNSFNDPPNFSDYPPQPSTRHTRASYVKMILTMIKDYRNEKINICFRRECENMIDKLKSKFNGMSIEIDKKIELQRLEQVANLSTYPSQRFKSFCYDDDDDYDYEECSIPLRDIISELPMSVAITPDLPTLEPEDSLIMGNEDLSTILEKESDEFIKSSVEDLVPIPSESKDTSESDMMKSLSDEDVPKENVKIYSNPLFEFDDEYISSDVNPLFDEVLENIESKDSYVSNLDEPALLVTPLSDFNEDECFDPGGDVDEIEFLLRRDPSTPKMSVVSILEGFTDEPPLEENDDLFDLESKANDWKKILYDAPIDDLMTEDKVFDPNIHKKFFSLTYVSLSFEDRHYLSFTYVIRIFLPYFTYPVEYSSLPLSSGSEDIIFDPGIFSFHFSSLNPMAYEYSREVCFSTCFVPNITLIWAESS